MESYHLLFKSWFPWSSNKDDCEYFLPELAYRTPEGDDADGPMIRQGKGRKELLVWATREGALAAARELVAQTGGEYRIRTVRRPEIVAECRKYAAWGSKVVAVIL
jgi:hypothetical protein